MARRYVTIGMKVKFDPFETGYGFGIDECRGDVIETVVEIHRGHKWFGVEYGDPKQRTAFKFCDIGKSVILVG